MSPVTIFQLHSLFTSGRKSVKDEERRRRLTITKIFENVAQMEQILKKDHRVNCRMIVESTWMPKTIVWHILQDDLKKRKLCSRFLPYTLTTEQ